ncbi:MAG: hypothetical protein JXK05_12425 [Campylobacterales bacterium]|nr:hypothetical protein [Campylobacterales bacterium]
MDDIIADEWTQEQFLREKARLEALGVQVVLVDTVLSPIDKVPSITYNPHEMKRYPEGTVFVFYCDTGKSTKERLGEFRKKFSAYRCISLYGGRGYWRKNLQVTP